MTTEAVEAVCEHIHNFFSDEQYAGTFTIEGGALSLDFLRAGQYFRIVGSLLNDGVYIYPAEGLNDEEFIGEIWPMRPPRAFLTLCESIAEWREKYDAVTQSPYQSENVIGVYSYTKAATSGGGDGWENAFKTKLNRWRRLSW